MTAPRNLALDASDTDFDAALALALPPVRCFEVSVTLPDGTRAIALRTGGNVLTHSQQAMERAGVGAVVRVRALPEPFQVKPL